MKTRHAAIAALAASIAGTACSDSTSPDSSQAVPAAQQAPAASAGPRYIPNRYIVSFRPSVRKGAMLASTLTRAHEGRLLHTYQSVMQGFVAELSDEAVEELRHNPDVLSIERDQVVTSAAGGVKTETPTPSWGLDRIDQTALPMDKAYRYAEEGLGVHIYILDSGINASHVDFGGRVSLDHSIITDGNGASDCYGHGTHVAGTAAGATYGVAKNAWLHSVRTLDCGGYGSVGGAIAALDWVTINHKKPAVVNMSLSSSYSSPLDQAVQNAVNAGIVVVVAAGNNGADACTRSPARAPAAITVSATDQYDSRVSWANYGTCVDMFAPGTAIVSTWIGSTTATQQKGGTSMASPHVAGAAALYLELYPTATPAQVEQALKTNAGTSVQNSSGSPTLLLNTTFLVNAVQAPVDAPPVPQFSASCAGRVCSFDGRASTDDKGVATYAWTFGDGSSAQGATASRSYTSNGTFNVTLTVTDGAGQSASLTKSVSAVDNAPVASFAVSCAGRTCSVDAQGSTDDRGIATYAWTFGDGASATGATASRTYAANGSYNITLTVTDNAGQASSVSKSVSAVDNAPSASASASCSYLTCSFNGTGSTDDRGIVSYSWAFGDGTTGTGAQPSHAYAAAGSYTATLTVTDASGQSSSRSVSVSVTVPPDMPPVANFTFSCPSGARTCYFDASSSTDDRGIKAYSWKFGDGAYNSGLTVNHGYAAAGVYTVTLKVTDTIGQTHTITKQVTLP